MKHAWSDLLPPMLADRARAIGEPVAPREGGPVPYWLAAGLLEAAPALAQAASCARMRACIAVMVAFPARIDVPFDAAFVHGSALRWIARDSSKPGHDADPDRWVLHAAHDWREPRLDAGRDELGSELLGELFRAIDRDPVEPIHRDVHVWRYALAEEPAGDPCLFDPALGIGACGNWCHGGRVESAFQSGLSMAGRVLGLVGRRQAPPTARRGTARPTGRAPAARPRTSDGPRFDPRADQPRGGKLAPARRRLG